MALRNLIAKITGTMPKEAPQEAELRALLASGDEARRNHQPDVALETYQRGLEMARNANYLQGQDVFLSQIGALQVERGDLEAAKAAFDEVLEVVNRMNEPLRRARAVLNLGVFSLTGGDLAAARRYLEQAVELARPTGDAATIGLALGNLADVHLRQDNATYAIHVLKEAVVLTQAAQNTQQAAYIIGLMGQAHIAVNELERGRRFLVQAVRLAQQYDQPDQELRWTSMLADQLVKAGQFEEARQFYSRLNELIPHVSKLPPGFGMKNLVSEGLVYQKLNQSEKALELTSKALALARQEDNAEVQALALANLGAIYQQLHQPEQAVASLEEAIDLYGGRAPNEVEHTNAMIALGKVYEDGGKADQAIEIFQRAVDEASEDNRVGRAMALRRVGSMLQQQGNVAGALEKWTEALAIFEAASETAQAARLLCDIGAARRALNGINAALPDYERATMLLSNVRDVGTRGVVLSNVANLYTDLGEVETAQSFYQESIALARQSGQTRAESLRLGNFGWFYTMTGQYSEAIRLLEQAIGFSRGLNDQLLLAVQTSNLGLAYHELKDYKTAEGLFDQSISMAEFSEQITDPRWKAMFLSNKARTLVAQGRLDEAQPMLSEALDVSRHVGDQETVSRTLTRLGDLYLKRGSASEADNVAREAENMARKWGYRKGQADALMVRANAARMLGDSATAERFTREALKLYSILHDPLAKELSQMLEAQSAG
ncbi:MAG TPA: tetratricopeptide repeat protein [Aggregatilineales bacterium]|nr:tetratricopeptide repeat protein [Aggregatilineales bacterium]